MSAPSVIGFWRWHNGRVYSRQSRRGRENEELMLAAPDLGLPFTIGGRHQDYLKLMRVDEAHQASVKGSKVRVAIVDSGLDSGAGITAKDFYDLDEETPVHATLAAMIDNDGHGTAMAKLVKAVAPDAEIYIVRVLDEGSVTLWNVLAGAGVAAFDRKATVVSMSLGFDSFLRCGVCGATGSARSVALEKMLDAITQSLPVATVSTLLPRVTKVQPPRLIHQPPTPAQWRSAQSTPSETVHRFRTTALPTSAI